MDGAPVTFRNTLVLDDGMITTLQTTKLWDHTLSCVIAYWVYSQLNKQTNKQTNKLRGP
jgi:hypothetical protein